MRKISIKEWAEKIHLVLLRFTFPVFFILGLSFLFFLEINQENADIQERVWAFFALSIPLSVAVTLFSEEFKNKLLRAGLNLLSTILLVIYILTLPESLRVSDDYQLIILGIVFTFSSFFASFLKKNNDIPFWEFSKTSIVQLVITFIFSLVLMLGLSLAVLSLDELFKVNISDRVYKNLAVICCGLFAPIYFLANVLDENEKRKHEFEFNKFLKVLGLYILLPILAVYVVILYVYLIQIIAKWELPNGWVSWLVSALALGGFLSMMILYPLRLQSENKSENKTATYFSRYLPVIIFPLLILMTIGIFRRFNDYGLTINRGYVFLLNFWLYGICIYLFFSKSKHLKWIIISFSLIAFLSSIGPWSVFNVTKQNMINEINHILAENHLIENGKVIDKADVEKIKIDEKQEQKLVSKIDYIVDNYGISALQPFFNDKIEGKTSAAINNRLAIKSKKGYSENQSFNINPINPDETVNIQDYNNFLKLRMNYDAETVFEDNQYKIKFINYQLQVYKTNVKTPFIIIPLKNKLKALAVAETENNYKPEDFTFDGHNYKLIINHLGGQRLASNDSIIINQFEANLFLK
ncbi:MAG: DUF4153 domain-containing protein [Bacteroidales bacterium]|nr:DUF4153 domain-containing protein [Bacteroidales bacterium]